MERKLKNFDYSKYPHMPQNRVPFEALKVGQRYRVAIMRPPGERFATYLGDGCYKVEGIWTEEDSVYEDWELDYSTSLVIPISEATQVEKL